MFGKDSHLIQTWPLNISHPITPHLVTSHQLSLMQSLSLPSFFVLSSKNIKKLINEDRYTNCWNVWWMYDASKECILLMLYKVIMYSIWVQEKNFINGSLCKISEVEVAMTNLTKLHATFKPQDGECSPSSEWDEACRTWYCISRGNFSKITEK